MKKITSALPVVALLCAGPALAKDTTPEEVRKEARDIFKTVIAFRTSEGWPGAGDGELSRRTVQGRVRRRGHARSASRGHGIAGRALSRRRQRRQADSAARPHGRRHSEAGGMAARSVHADRGERLLLRPRHSRQQARRDRSDDDVPAPAQGRLRAHARSDHRVQRRRRDGHEDHDGAGHDAPQSH